MKKERLHGAKGWAARGAKHGSIYVTEDGYIMIAMRRKTLTDDVGLAPSNIVRVEIKEPKKKKP